MREKGKRKRFFILRSSERVCFHKLGDDPEVRRGGGEMRILGKWRRLKGGLGSERLSKVSGGSLIEI
jgi:hypothetical protein